MSATSKLQPLQLLPISSNTDDFVVYLEKALRRMSQRCDQRLCFKFMPSEGRFPEETFRLTYDSTNPLGWAWLNQALPYQRTLSKTDFAPFWSKGEEARLREIGYASLPIRRWKTASMAVQSVMESGVGGLLRIFASAHRGEISSLLPGYVYHEAPHPHYVLFSPKLTSGLEPPQALKNLGVEPLDPVFGELSRFSCTGVYVPAKEAGRDSQERFLDILITPATEVEEPTL